ncbi:MAG TPA: creatininase family protein, partial [Alphaproteobacteria bacterium]|nr:creatininase family protein [Alphaproteobacteria bacterium]
MTARYWKDLTTEDFAGLDPQRQVTLLPVAATEQHGPHLPLSTDAAINAGIIARAVELVPMETPLLVLPMLPVGLSPEHRDFPGTLSVSAETLLRTVVEIAESVARAGLRKLILFNSHGGQPAAL